MKSKKISYAIKSNDSVFFSFNYDNIFYIFIFYIFIAFAILSFILEFTLLAFLIVSLILILGEPGPRTIKVPIDKLENIKFFKLCGIFMMKYQHTIFFEFTDFWKISNAVSQYINRSIK